MSDTVLIGLITGGISLIAGSGGMFVFLNNRQKNKQDEHSDAVSEWMKLYDEMKERLDKQEEENDKLKDELRELRQSVSDLNTKLENYKTYDAYIASLENYIDHLLNTIKTVSTEEAYKNASLKRPVKKSTVQV